VEKLESHNAVPEPFYKTTVKKEGNFLLLSEKKREKKIPNQNKFSFCNPVREVVFNLDLSYFLLGFLSVRLFGRVFPEKRKYNPGNTKEFTTTIKPKLNPRNEDFSPERREGREWTRDIPG